MSATAVGEMRINPRRTLRATFLTEKTARFFEVREHYEFRGDVKSTPLATRVPIERLPDLADMVTTALARARADGLLPQDDMQ